MLETWVVSLMCALDIEASPKLEGLKNGREQWICMSRNQHDGIIGGAH